MKKYIISEISFSFQRIVINKHFVGKLCVYVVHCKEQCIVHLKTSVGFGLERARPGC